MVRRVATARPVARRPYRSDIPRPKAWGLSGSPRGSAIARSCFSIVSDNIASNRERVIRPLPALRRTQEPVDEKNGARVQDHGRLQHIPDRGRGCDITLQDALRDMTCWQNEKDAAAQADTRPGSSGSRRLSGSFAEQRISRRWRMRGSALRRSWAHLEGNDARASAIHILVPEGEQGVQQVVGGNAGSAAATT